MSHGMIVQSTVLLLGILKKGPDPAPTFKKRANQNISGPHTHLMQNTLSISICALPFNKNFEKGARSRTHFQKAGQPEYFWATHPFNAKHPFNIYLCITILQEAFISIITNFLFLKNTFKIQKIYYNRFLPFLLSREKKS